jgi:hypothetical protein
MSRHIIPPDLFTILEDFKQEMLVTFNCIQIGKINSFDKTTQTAEIEMQMKTMLEDNSIISYPVLVDCPCFVLQGGGAFIEVPIAKDDYCIILFNDRDIDNWFSSGNVKEPKTIRKHSLADGIAIVGINHKSKVLTLDGNIIKIITNDNPFKLDAGSEKITLTTTGDIELTNAANIKLLGATEKFIKGTTFQVPLNVFMNVLKNGNTPVTPSTYLAYLNAIITAANTFEPFTTDAQMLSSKIKGE